MVNTDKSKNILWKIDLLECKFNQSNPRFKSTIKLVKSRNNENIIKKLTENETDINKLINKLKKVVFMKKYYSATKKLKNEILKITRNNTDINAKSDLKIFFNDEKNLESLITSKLIKVIMKSCYINKKKNDFALYISDDLKQLNISNKCEDNFLKIFNNDTLLICDFNNFLSFLWNKKSVKLILESFKSSFNLIIGNLAEKDKIIKKKHAQETKKLNNVSTSDDIKISNKFFLESDNVEKKIIDDVTVSFNKKFNDVLNNETLGDDLKDNNFTKSLKKNQNSLTLNNHDDVNKSISTHYNLPNLQTGFYNGLCSESDDNFSSNNIQNTGFLRKNRRGQRARRKIWEKKYREKANHIVKYKQNQLLNEKNYELNKKKIATTRSISKTLIADTQIKKKKTSDDFLNTNDLHPSWKAIKTNKEKNCNVMFKGKKIVFD